MLVAFNRAAILLFFISILAMSLVTAQDFQDFRNLTWCATTDEILLRERSHSPIRDMTYSDTVNGYTLEVTYRLLPDSEYLYGGQFLFIRAPNDEVLTLADYEALIATYAEIYGSPTVVSDTEHTFEEPTTLLRARYLSNATPPVVEVEYQSRAVLNAGRDGGLPNQRLHCESERLKVFLLSSLTNTPELLAQAVAADPEAFFEAATVALQAAFNARDAREQQLRSFFVELMNPAKPVIEDHRPIRGALDAPITIVEYADFQCPYCQEQAPILRQVLDAYPGVVRLVYKHFPQLGIHPLAADAAIYFEAIALQDPDKAWVFHDLVFAEQHRLYEDDSLGIDALQRFASEVGADLDWLNQESQEAESFGFAGCGTPSLLVNGLRLCGVHSFDDLSMLIEMFLEANPEWWERLAAF